MFVLSAEDNKTLGAILSKCDLKHIDYDKGVRYQKDCGSNCKGKCGGSCQAACKSTCSALF